MQFDSVHDEIQIALRNAETKKAILILLTKLFKEASKFSHEEFSSSLTDLVKTSYYELQSGANPKTVCTFLYTLYQKISFAKEAQQCLQLIKLYDKLNEEKIPCKTFADLRHYIERNDWNTHVTITEQGRLDYESSIGLWRMERLMSAFDVLLENFPQHTWLTAGDGRHASEARYINRKGGIATPSDISELLLKQAKEANLIKEYRVETIEKLSCADESYDFVVAKDMLHHSPQPLLGIFEMLRVAKQGICFIEPFDYSFNSFELLQANQTPRPIPWHGFEEGVGNYIYSFSDREIAKICMGMGLPFLACKGFHDIYDPKINGVNITEHPEVVLQLKLQTEHVESMAKQNKGLYNLVAYIILKKPATRQLAKAFTEHGYTICHLPCNTVITNVLTTHPSFAEKEA